jgi:hypothetical protein
MRVELFYFDGCPNWKVADQGLREALRTVGRDDITVHCRRIEDVAPEVQVS